MRKNFKWLDRSVLDEFLSSTSLHGVKYLGCRQKGWIEKVFWAIILVVFFSFSLRILRETWNTWQESPIVINTDNKPHSVATLPSPAFTYCGDYLVNRSALQSLIKNGNKNNLLEIFQISSAFRILPLFHSIYRRVWNESYNEVESGLSRNASFLMKNDVILKYFKTLIVTDPTIIINPSNINLKPQINFFNGICYTYNMVPSSLFYSNSTVFQDLDVIYESYTLKVHSLFDGLPIVLIENRLKNIAFMVPSFVTHLNDIYRHITDKEVAEFLGERRIDVERVSSLKFPVYALHSPWAIPFASGEWYRLPEIRFDGDVKSLTHPSHMYLDQTLRGKSPSERNCLLPSENNLKFFLQYSFKNCLRDCLSDAMLDKCGCVSFELPRTEDTLICGEISKICVDKVVEAHQGDAVSLGKCSCLSSCEEMEYNIGHREFLPVNNSGTYFYIVFRDIFFHPHVRTLSKTLEDFILSSVTYLDTFLGLSLISVVEIFYFIMLCIVQSFRNRRNYNNRTKLAINELIAPKKRIVSALSVDGTCKNEKEDFKRKHKRYKSM